VSLEDEVVAATRDLEDEATDMGPGLRRGIIVRPEFSCKERCAFGSDRCRPGSGGHHGVGSRRVLFYVSVPGRGGVAFELFTPIYTPDVPVRSWPYHPLGPVDFHIARPTEQAKDRLTHVSSACDITEQDDCWCDGTTLQAELGVETLLRGGKEAVWSWLAEAWLPDAIEMFREET
jgi:hypothetical protein